MKEIIGDEMSGASGGDGGGVPSIYSKLANATKEVLAEIVRLAQKRGMSGDKGGWKEFLNSYERFGSTHSDPKKRSHDVLLAFLRTLKEESDLKFLAKVMQCYSNRVIAEKLLNCRGSESPEQKLVRLTREHPSYPFDFTFSSYEEDWIVTKLRAKGKRKRYEEMIAVDCEMVLCEDGTEALVKICIVDRELQIKLDELVKPNKAVADYRTSITGLSAKELDGITCSLADIQKSMKKLLSHGTILVGHGLSNDLTALKVDHAKVIDTSYIFKYAGDSVRRKPSLVNLCKSVLGYEVRRKGEPHNCHDDACAAMKLVLAKIDKGFDGDLPPIIQEAVPEEEFNTLFIHGVPMTMTTEDLQKVIPGNYTFGLKMTKKGRNRIHSILAYFGDRQEALEAYDNLNGQEGEDSGGRLQKSVPIQLRSGDIGAIYVRKPMCSADPSEASTKSRPHKEEISVETNMLAAETTGRSNKRKKNSCNDPDEASVKNRPGEDEIAVVTGPMVVETTEKPKKKKNSCVDPVEEIERLKNLLAERDREISDLHKIVAALTRKQGL